MKTFLQNMKIAFVGVCCLTILDFSIQNSKLIGGIVGGGCVKGVNDFRCSDAAGSTCPASVVYRGCHSYVTNTLTCEVEAGSYNACNNTNCTERKNDKTDPGCVEGGS